MTEQTNRAARSADFRYVAADAIGFQFNDDVIKIVFGVEDVKGSVLEQSGVVLSHAAGKLLLLLLSESIQRFEQRASREIALNPAKVEEIMKVFSAVDAAEAGRKGT